MFWICVAAVVALVLLAAGRHDRRHGSTRVGTPDTVAEQQRLEAHLQANTHRQVGPDNPVVG